MAFGMKHWLGVVGVGVALVSILGLPPASIERPPYRATMLPEAVRLRALQTRLARVNATLRVDRTVADLVPATLAAPDGLTIRGTDRVSDSLAAGIRTRVHRELTAAGVTGHDVALGVFVAGHPANTLPGGYPNRAEYYWGSRDGRAYCFAVLPMGSRWEKNRWEHEQPSLEGFFASVLGPCELIAKYGLPGATVERWLGGPGETLAATAEPLSEDDKADLLQRYATLREIQSRNSSGPAQGFFGRSLASLRCWARKGAGCAALIENPADFGFQAQDSSSVVRYLLGHTALSAVDQGTNFMPGGAHFAADLAGEFGDARFEAFWKADKPFADAFESAFGTDLAGWSLAYLSQLLPPAKARTDVTLGTGLGTVLLLALAAILGTVWAKRRQVA
jgi:hypothetical protein